MTVVELAQVGLKHGLDIKSLDGDGYKSMQELLGTIRSQPGCLGLATGTTVENHENMDMIIEWADIKDHHKFQSSEIYPPFMGRAKEVMSGQPGCLIINHMHITSPIFELLEKSPVNEVLLLYVPQDAGDEVPATVDRFLEIASQTAQGATGYAHGWVVEQLEKEGHDGKLKGYYVFIGWDSVEAHMAYRETEAFKENIPMIRSLAKGLSVHHTKFTKYKS